MRQWLGWYEMRGLIEHDVGPLELELLVLLDIYHQGLTAFEEVRDLQRQDWPTRSRRSLPCGPSSRGEGSVTPRQNAPPKPPCDKQYIVL
jgi:hypothetical protein